MLPSGYTVVARYDRSRHGGGVIIFAHDHNLVDTVKCDTWCVAEVAEIVGFTYGDYAIFGCYTQSSEAAPQFFSALESIRTSKKFKGKKLAFFGC